MGSRRPSTGELELVRFLALSLLFSSQSFWTSFFFPRLNRLRPSRLNHALGTSPAIYLLTGETWRRRWRRTRRAELLCCCRPRRAAPSRSIPVFLGLVGGIGEWVGFPPRRPPFTVVPQSHPPPRPLGCPWRCPRPRLPLGGNPLRLRQRRCREWGERVPLGPDLPRVRPLRMDRWPPRRHPEGELLPCLPAARFLPFPAFWHGHADSGGQAFSLS